MFPFAADKFSGCVALAMFALAWAAGKGWKLGREHREVASSTSPLGASWNVHLGQSAPRSSVGHVVPCPVRGLRRLRLAGGGIVPESGCRMGVVVSTSLLPCLLAHLLVNPETRAN